MRARGKPNFNESDAGDRRRTQHQDSINYAGSWLAGTVLPRRALGALFDRVIASLHRRLNAETEDDLARSMRFPTRWDPFFREAMSLAEVYHFPTQHFDFHRAQLTLTR